MPELADLLRSTEPDRPPGFDVDDVRRRVDVRARRRRTRGAVVLGCVAFLAALVVLPRLLDQPGTAVIVQPTRSEPMGIDRSDTGPVGLDDLISRAEEAGYDVLVDGGSSVGGQVRVTFVPVGPDVAGDLATGTVVAHARQGATPGGPDDLAQRVRVATMYQVPVWATEDGDPLVDCGPIRLAGVVSAAPDLDRPGMDVPPDAALGAFEQMVGRMDCTPLWVIDPVALEADPSVTDLAEVLGGLLRAGHQVRGVVIDGPSQSLNFQPLAEGTSMVTVFLRAPRLDDAAPPVLVPLGDGTALVEASGMLAFECNGTLLATTGPSAGGSELAWVAELPAALGCTPAPTGVSQVVIDELNAGGATPGAASGEPVDRLNEREDRLLAAFAELGVSNVAGEPSHGGSGASMGIEWEGVLVYVHAGDALYNGSQVTRGRVIDFAGGQADLGDGDGLPRISFDCGDTNYQLTHDSSREDVHIRAAEALIGLLSCTPTVGG